MSSEEGVDLGKLVRGGGIAHEHRRDREKVERSRERTCVIMESNGDMVSGPTGALSRGVRGKGALSAVVGDGPHHVHDEGVDAAHEEGVTSMAVGKIVGEGD